MHPFTPDHQSGIIGEREGFAPYAKAIFKEKSPIGNDTMKYLQNFVAACSQKSSANMPSRCRRLQFTFILAIAFFHLSGCAALQQVQDALANLRRLQFKLDSVTPGSLAGISLSQASDVRSLTIQDGLKLTAAFANKSLPLSWTLNVAAKNPNDGTGGTPQRAAVLQSFAWTLKIDEKETISGDIANPLEIPGTGQTTIIPLQMSIDLYKFFGERGYKEVLNLALAVAGQKGSAARLTLVAVPTVSVAGIDLKYPGQISIVDKEFTNP